MNRHIFLTVVVLFATSAVADWRQFRGNHNTGLADDVKVPTQWSDTENLAWKVDLPGHGLSSPIVIRNQVFITASDGYEQNHLLVLAYDAATGKKLWQRDFMATGSTMRYPASPVATCSPCSDGERIFALYSSNDVVCLDLEGNLLWIRGLTMDYPGLGSSLGMASSPVVAGHTLVLQVESDSDSLACGLDVETGVNRWKTARPKMANWSSPVVLPGLTPDDDIVVLQSGKGLSAVRPYTGVEVWNFGEGASTIASSLAAGDLLLTPSNGIAALRPEPGAKSPKVEWRSGRLNPNTASPTAAGDFLYVINESILNGADLKTGKDTQPLRLPGKGTISSTPVAANGYLYILRESGLCIVVKAGQKPEKVFEFDFGETIQSTPAIADGALYVRGDTKMWKIAK